MSFEERATRFLCHGDWLYGILSLPKQLTSRGILIVVGGPQYRVGSHRQFTLLARYHASHGVPVMRFDLRGMGDSEGKMRTFEEVEDDLRCAIDQFFEEVPSLKDLVIWGLCDAASAALFYAHQDQRITGLVLLNPWVRTDQGLAKAYLKHYYLSRFFEADFWKKLWRGQLNIVATMQSLFKTISKILKKDKKSVLTLENEERSEFSHPASLPDRMLDGFKCFKGQSLLITSGKDLTAQEFLDLVKKSKSWQNQLSNFRVKQFNLPDANHTFSRYEWRNQVAVWTRDWINSW